MSDGARAAWFARGRVCLLVATVAQARANAQPAAWEALQPPTSQYFDAAPGCTIPRVDAAELSAEEFRDQYLEKRAVLVYNSEQAATNRARSLWNEAEFTAKFGRVPVRLRGAEQPSRGAIDSQGNQPAVETTIRDFLSQLGPHSIRRSDSSPLVAGNARGLFETLAPLSVTELQEIADEHQMLPWLVDEPETAPDLQLRPTVLTIGGHESSEAFRARGDTWLELVYGHKLWFVQPVDEGTPAGGFSHDEPLTAWFDRVYANATLRAELEPGMQHCVQAPGEVMYVPEDWLHGSINQGVAVGIGGVRAYSVRGSGLIAFKIQHALSEPKRAMIPVSDTYLRLRALAMHAVLPCTRSQLDCSWLIISQRGRCES